MAGNPLKRTPLHEWHVQLGARMTDYVGWDMPLLYRGIQEEHRHTREACSVFDVSHMGRLDVRGDGAGAFLELLCTRRLGDMEPGRMRYSHVCHERGGVLDDVLVARHETHWSVVCNACNRPKIVAWLRRHAEGREVAIDDITESTAMMAVQGPRTMDEAARRIPLPLADLPRYGFRSGEYFGMRYVVSRTGYTGEDGFEVILPTQAAVMGWQFLLQADDEFAPAVILPAGLGARDTLRIEAGMPLYGHELREGIDPLTAGFAWCVDLEKDFVGADAIRAVRNAGPTRRRVGLSLAGRRIARQGCEVLHNGRVVGEITSGTISPTLDRSIAMAYLACELATIGTSLRVRIRNHEEEAVVVELPFYRRKQRGTQAT